jgi:methionyl-tRNA formyltransferase
VTVPARTVFLGSGSFAVPIVARLAQHPAAELVGVVSAPPRPRGRGHRLEASPVGRWATDAGLEALTPERLRSSEAQADIARLEPDLLVLADYGQIVPETLLELPAHGALNLHPSLLPRHRGATPIAAAILAGDSETGVTLMRMDAGLDTGPIIAQRRIHLDGGETAPLLEERLSNLAAEVLDESLSPWLSGELSGRSQPAEGATLTRPLRRPDGELDVRRPAAELERQVRAYQPWPGSFIETSLGRLIIWVARVLPAAGGHPPGRLLALPTAAADGGGLALTTADGLLEIVDVQPAGGRRMGAAELLRGRPELASARITSASSAGSGSSR